MMVDDTENSPLPAESVAAETVSPPPPEQTPPAEPAPLAVQAPEVIPEVTQPATETVAEPPVAESSIAEPAPAQSQPMTSAPASTSAPAQEGIPTAQSGQAPQPQKWSAEDRAQAAATHARRYEARLAKMVEFARTQSRIANRDIEKLLRVSHATASRYGKTLVERGLLVREGKGRGASYLPKL